MSVRKSALAWYKSKYGKLDFPIYTSKFFREYESWTKRSVWWPKIPKSEIEKNSTSFINIICQAGPDKNDYYHLKIPSKFLKEHFDKFHTLGNKITLFLSTDSKKLFVEEKGKGNLSFKIFLVNGVV